MEKLRLSCENDNCRYDCGDKRLGGDQTQSAQTNFGEPVENVCGTQNCGEALANNCRDEMERKSCGDNNYGEERLDGVHTQSAQSNNGDPVEDVCGPQNCENDNCGEATTRHCGDEHLNCGDDCGNKRLGDDHTQSA